MHANGVAMKQRRSAPNPTHSAAKSTDRGRREAESGDARERKGESGSGGPDKRRQHGMLDFSLHAVNRTTNALCCRAETEWLCAVPTLRLFLVPVTRGRALGSAVFPNFPATKDL